MGEVPSPSIYFGYQRHVRSQYMALPVPQYKQRAIDIYLSTLHFPLLITSQNARIAPILIHREFLVGRIVPNEIRVRK